MRAIASILLAALSVAACSNDPGTPPAGGEGATSPPAADAPAALSYRCDDGTMLQVAFGETDAEVRWADGRSTRLPRAESASAGNDGAYVGADASLQRTPDGIELHEGDAPARACREVPPGGATAAAGAEEAEVSMRYACDADTVVAMLADGTARISLPDGQTVDASRIAGSAPPVFTGQSLYFTIDEGGARLSQENQARELACRPA